MWHAVQTDSASVSGSPFLRLGPCTQQAAHRYRETGQEAGGLAQGGGGETRDTAQAESSSRGLPFPRL